MNSTQDPYANETELVMFFRKSHPRKGASSTWSQGSGNRYGSQNFQRGKYTRNSYSHNQGDKGERQPAK